MHALEVRLDRVLDGGHVVGHGVEGAERRVERGGLAAAGWAGDEHDAVRLVDHALEVGEHLRAEAELLQAELGGGDVDDAHDDLLAELAGERAHAQVDGLALDAHGDLAVLRDAALGDVQVRHDLDAARDGRMHAVRRGHLVEEHAVDAVAHAQVAFVGLDVDVAGALGGGAADDEVDELDHRADVVGGVEAHHLLDLLLLQLVVGLVGAVEEVGDQFLGLLVDVLRGAGRVAQELVDALVGRGHEAHLEAGLAGDQFLDEVVLRIGGGNHQLVAGQEQRADAVLAAERFRDQRHGAFLEHGGGLVHELHAAALGHGAQEDGLVDHAELHQHLAEEQSLPALHLRGKRLAQLVGAERAVLHQDLPEGRQRGQLQVQGPGGVVVAADAVVAVAVVVRMAHFLPPLAPAGAEAPLAAMRA